ncbi:MULTISPECIES: N-acetylmuramic acid 6-phosphate etherase [unclassified Thalassospira]|uniref:N-acetylmuramic acid 6-phosphate etherase n=1 Tax=unclassified Thalassospira TaxID=2648997 RepID=UPI001B2A6B11|nr:N-acetylmuramic acid 6-phosphate etherase [Thalassospira sp.]MBO6771113.1 N-acetylmuramic acid 6-phosphate etherase [Thalassospira sp.]
MASRTEDFDSRFAGLDQWSDADFLMALWEGQMRAVASVGPILGDLATAANGIARRLGGGGRLVYVGAGTSGTVAWQDAKELGGTFGWPESHTIVMLAGGVQSAPNEFNGAEDDTSLAEREISQNNISENDAVIAIAASGATPYTVRALELARDRGAFTVGICNNQDGKILGVAETGIFLDSAPEVVAGSTRMGAGTAQKAALNILSTLVMNKLGRLFDNLMVGMRAENIKLRGRAVRIVSHIAYCDAELASDALEKSDFDIRVAVLVTKGHSPDQAKEILALSNGNLRAALEYRN